MSITVLPPLAFTNMFKPSTLVKTLLLRLTVAEKPAWLYGVTIMGLEPAEICVMAQSLSKKEDVLKSFVAEVLNAHPYCACPNPALSTIVSCLLKEKSTWQRKGLLALTLPKSRDVILKLEAMSMRREDITGNLVKSIVVMGLLLRLSAERQ